MSLDDKQKINSISIDGTEMTFVKGSVHYSLHWGDFDKEIHRASKKTDSGKIKQCLESSAASFFLD